VVSEIGGQGERYLTYDEYAGLGTRQPFAAAALTVFLLSLLGLPITAGFFGKFYVFKAAIRSDLVWLAVFIAINTIIGAYYYFRLIVTMYMREYKGTAPVDASKGMSPTAAMVVAVTVLITLYLGLLPNHILGIILSRPLILSAR
jgi:NADH-quinone oxidoreductase subunit N